MDGGDPARWSQIAPDWSELWGDFPLPIWELILHRTGIASGRRVLDAGCGSGDMLAHFVAAGAEVAGFDPAAGMVAAAQRRLPGADIRTADLSSLPWPAAAFDVVVSVNAVQFAADTTAAVAELLRVCRPDGFVVLAGWAEDTHNDLARLEAAAAAARGRRLPPDGPLRRPGGLSALLGTAGALVEVAGEVPLTWTAPDDATLLRGVLLGELPDVVEGVSAAVLDAAAPFRRPEGYVLVNAFRYAIARPAQE